MSDKQVDIRSASFRVVQATPGHITYGVWVNGGKSGNLVVRVEESVGFEIMMKRAGFEQTAHFDGQSIRAPSAANRGPDDA